MSYEYLAHHGILGQKWGVRRFQNKDGSYTSLGARRHAKAAEAAQRDADDLRKHGYKKEADAVQKVADKQRAKLADIMNKKVSEINKRHQKEIEDMIKDRINPTRNSKQPWDEKPNYKQPWDEKPDKSRKGNI